MSSSNIFSRYDIKIINIIPSPPLYKSKRRYFEEIHFTVDGFPKEAPYYEFMYCPESEEDSWFSDLPEEFEEMDDDSNDFRENLYHAFYSFVKNWILKQKLSPETSQTFSDIIDEL